MGQIVQADLA